MEKKQKEILQKIDNLREREVKVGKIYLNVPFIKKNLAKKLGAWWDSEEKKWYAPMSNGKRFKRVNYEKLEELFGIKQ